MALTITEAQAVNTIASYLLGQPRAAMGERVSSEAVRDALALLVDKADKVRSAGVTGRFVVATWPSSLPEGLTHYERALISNRAVDRAASGDDWRCGRASGFALALSFLSDWTRGAVGTPLAEQRAAAVTEGGEDR